MYVLHIVQGGVENGDKDWLERAARKKLDSTTWVVPKSVSIGDQVVIYITGYGFFATAKIRSQPKPRKDWINRYGSALTSIKLIEPAISLATIRRRIPELTWAKYPRSITTPTLKIADEILKLIKKRRATGIPDLNDKALLGANIDELRKVASLRARPHATQKDRKAIYRARSKAIRLYVLCRANGSCESCTAPAPFRTANGSPYIEPHHTTRLADDGPDHPAHVIGLCPNCHRRAHYAKDAEVFNGSLIKRLATLEHR